MPDQNNLALFRGTHPCRDELSSWQYNDHHVFWTVIAPQKKLLDTIFRSLLISSPGCLRKSTSPSVTRYAWTSESNALGLRLGCGCLRNQKTNYFVNDAMIGPGFLCLH